MDFKRESSREEEGQAFYETSTGTLQIEADKQVLCQFLLVYQLSFTPPPKSCHLVAVIFIFLQPSCVLKCRPNNNTRFFRLCIHVKIESYRGRLEKRMRKQTHMADFNCLCQLTSS